jgi:hypothetical protein
MPAVSVNLRRRPFVAAGGSALLLERLMKAVGIISATGLKRHCEVLLEEVCQTRRVFVTRYDYCGCDSRLKRKL